MHLYYANLILSYKRVSKLRASYLYLNQKLKISKLRSQGRCLRLAVAKSRARWSQKWLALRFLYEGLCQKWTIPRKKQDPSWGSGDWQCGTIATKLWRLSGSIVRKTRSEALSWFCDFWNPPDLRWTCRRCCFQGSSVFAMRGAI